MNRIDFASDCQRLLLYISNADLLLFVLEYNITFDMNRIINHTEHILILVLICCHMGFDYLVVMGSEICMEISPNRNNLLSRFQRKNS